jgi:hypothetical protein
MRFVGGAAATCLLVAVSACGSAAAVARSSVVGCQPQAGKQIALTRSYRYALRLGAPENMYMPYQVRANHPKHGEAMLRGTMSGSPSLLTGGPIRHLEVQICTRRTSAVVTHAKPRISVVDETTGRTRKLPVAVMEDISVGAADLHYGNNIAMSPKHRYLVSVTWGGQPVEFRVRPKA